MADWQTEAIRRDMSSLKRNGKFISREGSKSLE